MEHERDELTGRVIGAAIEVHSILGPGLLESACRNCLAKEMALRGIAFVREQPLPLVYKELRLEHGYAMDFVVERRLILEIKAIEALAPLHEAQTITYLRLSGLPTALLMNFNVLRLRDGLRRFVL
jgi:GxxExxY protein